MRGVDKDRTRRSLFRIAGGVAIAGIHSFAQIRGPFEGTASGDERELSGIKLCWCPAGRFVMGSPRSEPARRPGEDQIEVRTTKGFWTAKYEATQGQWKRVVGELPGPLTAELLEGDDFPVGNVNFLEAEDFCRRLTERGHQSGELPKNLGVSPAHRCTMGIRVPCRDDNRHRLWQQPQQ
jgi:hypothetical protein